ncbi:MAG: transferase [Chloroflexi bacterium]|nr:transferase [Chloroflexota bacterium]
MLKTLVILGAGGFAREILDIVDSINTVSPTWNMLGFLVDSQYGEVGTIIQEKTILGNFSWLKEHSDVYVVCGVGTPHYRWHMIERLRELPISFATLVHPSVIKTRWITIGKGSVITAGCVLSNHITIADHVHINPSCTIGHDVTLGPFVSVAPGVLVSGNVNLYEGVYVGTGASIIEKKNIGAWSIVGAGSTVTKDVPANSTVVGVPAKVIKQRPEGWHLRED